MAITLNELKARNAQSQAINNVPAVVAPVQEEEKATLWTKSLDALKGTGKAIDASLPVSKRMFADMATKRLDAHDVELRLIQHELELLAHNQGGERPSREDLLAYDAQLQKEKAETEEAARLVKEAEEKAKQPQTEKAVVDKSVMEQLRAAMEDLLGSDKEVPVKEEPVKAEEPKTESLADTLKGHLSEIKDPAIRAQLEALVIGTPGKQPTAEEIVTYEEPKAQEAPATDYEAVEKEHLGDIDKGTGIYAERETVPAQDKPASGRRKLPRNAPLME